MSEGMKILGALMEGTKHDKREEKEARLVKKWKKTGLLEGLTTDREKGNMALLLENEVRYVKRLLTESSSMAGGNVEGFAQSSLPMVRRILGRIIANKVVSVQPMDLPTTLIFFIDFTYADDRLQYTAGDSVYGGGRVGSEISQGVLVDDLADGSVRYSEIGMQALNNGYSMPTGSTGPVITAVTTAQADTTVGADQDEDATWIEGDADLLDGTHYTVVDVDLTDPAWADVQAQASFDNLIAFNTTLVDPDGATLVRRLTKRIKGTGVDTLRLVFHKDAAFTGDLELLVGQLLTLEYPINDTFETGSSLGSVVGNAPWELEFQEDIPEIDIKVNSLDVRADTRKLKARYSQELDKDLAAYHSVNAEVELSNILTEHVEMDINNELLTDLLKGGTAGTVFWSRQPGRFVDRFSGADVSAGVNPPDFTGNVSEWYETLGEHIQDLSARIHRKMKRGGANFIVTSPEIAVILQFMNGFSASVSLDDMTKTGEAGVRHIGKITRQWDVYIDPNFKKNIILVGRKGGSFLETGYVYCPYVPLEILPTILHPEDFTPRKMVYTRYGKKMVRPDYYGRIVVLDLNR